MRIFSVFLLLSFAIIGCASSLMSSPLSNKELKLQDVEHVRVGFATSLDLQKTFGAPTKTLGNIFKNEDVWFYDATLNGEQVTRVSFTLSKNEGLVLGVVWIPFSSDELSHEQGVLAHFKSNHFVRKKIAMSSNHEYVNDIDYIDEKSGVSFSVIKPSGLVTSISFGVPKDTRIPAKVSNSI